MKTALEVSRAFQPHEPQVATDLLLLVDDYNLSVPKWEFWNFRRKVREFLDTLDKTEVFHAEAPYSWPEFAALIEALDAS
jgi:hypothetical protein